MNRKSYEAVTQKNCPPISNAEFNQIKCQTKSSLNQNHNLDELSEYLIFSDLIKEELSRLDCASSTLKKLISNERIQNKMVQNTCERLGHLQLVLQQQKEVENSIERYKVLNDRTVRIIPEDQFQKNLKNLEDLQKKKVRIEKELQVIQSTDTLLKSERVYKSVADWLTPGIVIAEKNSSQTCELLKKNIASLLNKDLEDLTQSSSLISKKTSDGQSWLTDTAFKRQLWGTEHGLKLPAATVCRFESRYGEGAKHWDHLSNIWLLGGSILGGQLVRLSTFIFVDDATLSYRAARLALITETTSSTGISTYQALQECQEKLKVFTNQKSCSNLSDEEFESLTTKQQEANSCLFTATMAALNGVISAQVVTATLKEDQVLTRVLSRQELRRSPVIEKIQEENLYGTRLGKVNQPGLPDSVAVSEYLRADGSKYFMYEKSVSLSGKTQYLSRELPMDKLTGAIDANYPAGKDLLMTTLHENQGKSFFTFIDVNNLGYINKNFAKGPAAGDDYLKNIGEALTSATKGKAQLYKLGGDEFGLVIHESDPEKAQEILSQLLKNVYSKNTHQIFTEEKKALAEMYKRGLITAKELQQKSGYLKEGVSLGAVRPNVGESFDSVLTQAETQAAKMKVETKAQLNTDARKSGGLPYDETKKSNQRYQPQAPKIEKTIAKTTEIKKLPSLQDATPAIPDRRIETLYRFGNTSVVKYRNALGEDVIRYEKYLPTKNENKQFVSGELFIHQTTGLIDGASDQGKELINQFISSSNLNRPKAVIWINAENLGKINYFEKGTQAGNEYLKATSDVIQSELSTAGVPFKMQGSEFIVGITQGNAQQISTIERKLKAALNHNPNIQKIFSDQRTYLNNQLSRAQTPSEVIEIKNKLEELKKTSSRFTIKSTLVNPQETIENILTQAKGQ